MLYRILDLRFCTKRRRFDDEPLQRLLHGHRLIAAREWFYTHDGEPHLLVSVHYALAHLDAAAARPPVGNRERDADWKEILREENATLFDTLRTWRSARARADAVPPYVVLTNAQLAHVANAQATTRAELGAVDGLGPARLERYADELLRVIATGALPPEFADASGNGGQKQGKPHRAKKPGAPSAAADTAPPAAEPTPGGMEP